MMAPTMVQAYAQEWAGNDQRRHADHSCVDIDRTTGMAQGGGEVTLRVPVVKELPPVSLTNEGLVKRIRGVAHSMKASNPRPPHSGVRGLALVSLRPGNSSAYSDG